MKGISINRSINLIMTDIWRDFNFIIEILWIILCRFWIIEIIIQIILNRLRFWYRWGLCIEWVIIWIF